MGLLTILAIDPGDVHIGWAIGTGKEGDSDWKVTSGEVSHDDAVNFVQSLLETDDIDVVVIEKFVLYADKASAQTWSPMKTSELIGKLTLLATMYDAEVQMQGAFIKKPIKAQLKARGIKSTGGHGGHANDAVLHLWYRVLRGKS